LIKWSVTKDLIRKNHGIKEKATITSGIKSVFNCNKCGRQHSIRECPAYGRLCTNCNKQNQFAVKCRNNKNIDVVEYEEQMGDYLCLDKIQNKNNNIWLETI